MTIPPELYQSIRERHARAARIIRKKARREPAVGFFWVMPLQADSAPQLVSFSTPASEVYPIGGYRTDDRGHYQSWEILAQAEPYSAYEYDHWPRGRINFIEEAGQFLVLADRKINKDKYKRKIIREFNLPKPRVRWDFTDLHYVSEAGMDGQGTIAGFA